MQVCAASRRLCDRIEIVCKFAVLYSTQCMHGLSGKLGKGRNECKGPVIIKCGAGSFTVEVISLKFSDLQGSLSILVTFCWGVIIF